MILDGVRVIYLSEDATIFANAGKSQFRFNISEVNLYKIHVNKT